MRSPWLCLFLLCGSITTITAWARNTASLEDGFHQMYNLNFPAAHQAFEAWEQVHPDDPLGAASNAAAYLFGEFERLHILKLDLLADAHRVEDIDRLPPDPKIKIAFDRELAKADQISERILGQTSTDCNALFARTLADGLRGDYAGLIEKKKHAGLDFLKASRSNAEKLIALDPGYYDAYLAVGIENYLLGLHSAPTRWILRLSGAETNKEKGIENLRMTAEKGDLLAPYARLLLAIVALRDEDRDTAIKLLTVLAHEFPGNRVYQAELARLQS